MFLKSRQLEEHEWLRHTKTDLRRMTQSRSTLHWLTVLVVAMQFVIDWTMPHVHKGTQPVSLIAWHLGLA